MKRLNRFYEKSNSSKKALHSLLQARLLYLHCLPLHQRASTPRGQHALKETQSRAQLEAI